MAPEVGLALFPFKPPVSIKPNNHKELRLTTRNALISSKIAQIGQNST